MGSKSSNLIFDLPGRGELYQKADEYFWRNFVSGNTYSCHVEIFPFAGECPEEVILIREGDTRMMRFKNFSFERSYSVEQLKLTYSRNGSIIRNDLGGIGDVLGYMSYKIRFTPACLRIWEVQFPGARIQIPVIQLGVNVEKWLAERGATYKVIYDNAGL